MWERSASETRRTSCPRTVTTQVGARDLPLLLCTLQGGQRSTATPHVIRTLRPAVPRSHHGEQRSTSTPQATFSIDHPSHTLVSFRLAPTYCSSRSSSAAVPLSDSRKLILHWKLTSVVGATRRRSMRDDCTTISRRRRFQRGDWCDPRPRRYFLASHSVQLWIERAGNDALGGFLERTEDGGRLTTAVVELTAPFLGGALLNRPTITLDVANGRTKHLRDYVQT